MVRIPIMLTKVVGIVRIPITLTNIVEIVRMPPEVF